VHLWDAGLTRTPCIHYSGGFSCLTLYFDRSWSVSATLQFTDHSFTVKQACTYSTEHTQKNVEYSVVAEYIHLEKTSLLLQQHYVSRSGPYWIRRNPLCFWLSTLYHFGIHQNNIQSPWKTNITHWLNSSPKKHKTNHI
jgi:hypothetical protein